MIRRSHLFAFASCVLAVWSGGASSAFAHPDHPVQIVASNSWLHYALQPEHALPPLMFVAAVWLLHRSAIAKLSERVAG